VKLFSLVLAIGLVTGSCSGSAENKTVIDSTVQVVSKDLSPEIYKKFLTEKQGVLLDVRFMEEYTEGHIPNSIFANINGDEFESEVAKLDKDKPVFVYCKLGGRSSKAQKILISQGFKEVYNLKGGISAWQGQGHEVEK